MLKAVGNITMEIGYGNSGNFFIELTNSSDQPIDLTGADILFTVKRTKDIEDIEPLDENALLQKVIPNDTPTEGKFTLSLTPADTEQIGFGDFNYDFRVTRSSTSSYTTPVGILSINRVVTQK